MPFTPGNEGAGEIVAVGPGVKDFKPGDRVAYAGSLGSYAEERNIEARFLVKLPRAISYETAAAMMLKGLTAQYLLRQTYRVKEGDWILVHAAAGGVGQILCQWGRALGANGDRHGRLAGKGQDRQEGRARSTRSSIARRISPSGSARSPRARNAPSSTTASARRPFPLRSIA